MPSPPAFGCFFKLFRLLTRSGISMLCRSAAFLGVPYRYSRGGEYIGARGGLHSFRLLDKSEVED